MIIYEYLKACNCTLHITNTFSFTGVYAADSCKLVTLTAVHNLHNN